MFSSISTQQTCRAANQTVNCTLPGPGEFETNADIAGIGVSLSILHADISTRLAKTEQVVYAYEVTALLTLIFASLLTMIDFLDLFCSSRRYERIQDQKE